MNPEQRLELIRARLKRSGDNGKVTAKGLFVADHPEVKPLTRKQRLSPATRGEPLGNFGPIRRLDLKDKPWLYNVLANPVKEWEPKPRHVPHALTRIAEKWKGLKR